MESTEITSPVPTEIRLDQEFYPFAGPNVKKSFKEEKRLLETLRELPDVIKDKQQLMGAMGFIDSIRRSKKPFEFRYESTAFLKLPAQVSSQPLEIEIMLRGSDDDALGIFPFSKKEGYVIDNEDSNLETRRAKIKKRAEPRGEFLYGLTIEDDEDSGINPVAPHLLVISITTESLQRAGLVDIDANSRGSLSTKGGQLLNSLRCVVRANGLYISKGNIENFPIGKSESFMFISFSPIDAKIAAETYYTSYYQHNGKVDVGEGHELFFPAKEKERKQIGIHFTLDPSLG